MSLSRPARAHGVGTDHDGLNLVNVAQGGDVVIFIRGEIDIATAPMLWERLDGAIPDVSTRLVLDLDEVPFIDSMGLGVIARAVKRLHHGGADLVLRHPSPQVSKVLSVSGLDRVLTVQG